MVHIPTEELVFPITDVVHKLNSTSITVSATLAVLLEILEKEESLSPATKQAITVVLQGYEKNLHKRTSRDFIILPNK